VDDILNFFYGSRKDIGKLSEGLLIFKQATGMEINNQKSSITLSHLSAEDTIHISTRLPFRVFALDDGLKYLGFQLKPNDYRKIGWGWLSEKIEKRLKGWSHRWISRVGRLVLVKVVLEAIPVY